MKIKYLAGKLLLLAALFVFGCKKDNIEVPEFNATIHKQTYKVGDTVVFNMEGNPDYISFYSGEYLNDYAFIGGRSLDIKSFNLSFQSRVQNGNQKDQLSVYLSSDFKGKFDIESIRAGNFQDMTTLVNLGTVNAVYAPSGLLELTPLVKDRTKPLYIAFRYLTKPQDAVNGTQRTWTIRELALNTITDLGQSVAIDQLTAAWTIVEAGAIVDAGRSAITANSGQITFRGNNSTEGKLVQTEAWAVSKAIDLNTIILGPDRAVPVKGISDTTPPVFSHVYTKPGNYKAVFEISNNRIDGKKTILKEINLIVTP